MIRQTNTIGVSEPDPPNQSSDGPERAGSVRRCGHNDAQIVSVGIFLGLGVGPAIWSSELAQAVGPGRSVSWSAVSLAMVGGMAGDGAVGAVDAVSGMPLGDFPGIQTRFGLPNCARSDCRFRRWPFDTGNGGADVAGEVGWQGTRSVWRSPDGARLDRACRVGPWRSRALGGRARSQPPQKSALTDSSKVRGAASVRPSRAADCQ